MASNNFDEQMRMFEAEVGQGPRHRVPPPPSFPPRQAFKTVGGGQKEYSSPAVISKPVESGGDDVFSTLLKYEKEVRQEKREKKKEAKLTGVTSVPSHSITKPRPEPTYKSSGATIAAPPSKPASSGSTMMPSSLMKTSHISANPTPSVKPGTQVTPDEIKLKAKQMVDLVRASQVIQTKKLPPSQGTSSSASAESGSSKSKKPKKMIRIAGGQVWEDTSLMNWDHNDYRLFCGDLGNDVTDEV